MIGNITKGSDFGGLGRYLLTGTAKGVKGGLGDYLVAEPQGKAGRVAWMTSRNLGGLEDMDAIAWTMQQTVDQARRKGRTRSDKPTYHFSISFSPLDRPNRAMMEAVVDRVLGDQRLGLAEHQAFVVAHADRDHPHVHVMLNRVHPETGKLWRDSHDYARMGLALNEICREDGLTLVPNPKLVQKYKALERRGERDAAEAIRQDTLIGWGKAHVRELRETLKPGLAQARSWRELEGVAAAQGLKLERKGQGLIATDGKSYAKFSDLAGKADRFAELEKRYGQRFDDYVAEDLALETPDPAEDVPADTPKRKLRSGRTSSITYRPPHLYGKDTDLSARERYRRRRDRSRDRDEDRDDWER